MKQKLSSVRILLAVILSGMAVLVFTHWPRSALCQIVAEEMVGFDEGRGLFYTTHLTGDGQKLNIYELATGLKRSSEILSLPINWNGSSFCWPCLLSGDKRFLIAVSMYREQVHVFKLPSLTPVDFNVPKLAHRQPEDMGFSLDSGAMVLRKREMDYDLIQVLDLDKATIQVSHIVYPSPYMIRGFSMNVAPHESMHLSSDRRYLATSLVGRNCVLYDLIEKKELLRTDIDKGFARFTPDGQTLVFLPENNRDDQEAIWYRLENGKWSLSGKRKLPLIKGEYILQACDHFFVAVRSEITERTWLKRVPEWLRNKVTQLLPPERLHLRFWDLSTGQLKSELSLDIPANPFDSRSSIGFNFHFNMRAELIVSSDGQYVAWKKEGAISVWEASPRHSLSCWISCSSLVLLAGWLAWPRRVKVTTQA